MTTTQLLRHIDKLTRALNVAAKTGKPVRLPKNAKSVEAAVKAVRS